MEAVGSGAEGIRVGVDEMHADELRGSLIRFRKKATGAGIVTTSAPADCTIGEKLATDVDAAVGAKMPDAMSQPEEKTKQEQRKERKKAQKETKAPMIPASPQKLRILALHGGMSCASALEGKMKNIRKATREIADFDFLDAPEMTICPDFSQSKHGEPYVFIDTGAVDMQTRSWFGWNSFDRHDKRYAVHGHDMDGFVYQKLDETFQLLQTTWMDAQHAGRPYDGIFGFSQGAVVASIFNDWFTKKRQSGHNIESEEVVASSMPRFLILVSAFLKPVPLNMPDYWTSDENTIREMLQATSCSCQSESEDANETESAALLHSNLSDMYVMRENRSGQDHDGFLQTKPQISTTPSLHIFGAADEIMPNERSFNLARKYAGAVEYRHDFRRGHEVPQDKHDIQPLLEFLQKFREE